MFLFEYFFLKPSFKTSFLSSWPFQNRSHNDLHFSLELWVGSPQNIYFLCIFGRSLWISYAPGLFSFFLRNFVYQLCTNLYAIACTKSYITAHKLQLSTKKYIAQECADYSRVTVRFFQFPGSTPLWGFLLPGPSASGQGWPGLARVGQGQYRAGQGCTPRRVVVPLTELETVV